MFQDDDDPLDTPYRQAINGPALRQLRLSKGITLRRVAREAKLSHGHLSKVERSEPFRPVTPAVITAYERATGVDLRALRDENGEARRWRAGHLGEPAASGFAATVASIAMGGPLTSPHIRGERRSTRLTSYVEAHRLRPLGQAEPADVKVLDTVTGALEEAGGRLAGLVAREVLVGVAFPLLDDEPAPELTVVAGRLARLAGQAVAHRSLDASRALHLVALSMAAAADDPQLLGCVLADIAAQLCRTDNAEVAARIARFSLHDERVSEPVRARLRRIVGTATDSGQRTGHDPATAAG